MSHIAEIKVEVKDLECLAEAAEQIGMKLVKGKTSYRWYGRSYGGQTLPEGFAQNDLGKCEHTLQIKGNNEAYEIGVVSRRDGKPGYHLLWDNWQGGGGLTDIVGENAEKLTSAYALESSIKALQMSGFRVNRNQIKRENGSITFQGVK